MSWRVSLSDVAHEFQVFVDELLAPRQKSGRAGAAGAARGVVRDVKGFAPRVCAHVPSTSPREDERRGSSAHCHETPAWVRGVAHYPQGPGGGLPHDPSMYDTVAAAVNQHMTTRHMKDSHASRSLPTHGEGVNV